MNLQIVKEAKNGIEYLTARIQTKQSVYTEVVLWKIPRTDGTPDFSLKIGRYKLETDGFLFAEYSTPSPKCEVTLDDEELSGFLGFLQQSYEPFTKGIKSFIPIEKDIDKGRFHYIKSIFDTSDPESILSFLSENSVIPEDILSSLDSIQRKKQVIEFEKLINYSDYFNKFKEENNIKQDEAVWQKWFTQNSWVLGTELIEVLDERRIDTANITDFLVKTYDGFVDIVEIKKSNGLNFWAKEKDHDNWIPSTELVKAITQSIKYIYEIEREANSVKFLESLKNTKTIKPRITLIFGRSNEWTDSEKEDYRILNYSYHNVSIMTYDHVLERAKKIIGMK